MKTNILLFLVLTSLASCAGLTQKIDKDKVKDVHNVAILAVEIQQQLPADNLKLGALMQTKDGPVGDMPEMQMMSKKITDNFIEELQKKTGWQVLPMNKVINNPEYKAKVAKDMEGLRTTLMGANGYEAIYQKDALDAMAFRKTSLAEREKLAKSLGVDAIAEVVIVNDIDQGWALGNIMGEGSFSYTSRANLQVYDPKSEEPVWRSQNIEGELTKSSDTLPPKMTKFQKLSNLGEEASMSAIKKLVETYQL